MSSDRVSEGVSICIVRIQSNRAIKLQCLVWDVDVADLKMMLCERARNVGATFSR